jgi:SMC interacting uncharacterized protein involved in chromosome segregation
MSEQSGTTTSEELKQKLNQQIDAARGKLDALKKEIVSMHEGDMETLREKQDELHARLERQKDQTRQIQGAVAKWREEKIAHTKDAIASWRQRRELAKLQDRAEQAEDFAVRMVNLAAIDFEEAEQAVLDAVAARFDAETAITASAR